MSIMKITLIGIQMALSMKNESVFDLMDLPQGIDKDTLEANILLEGSDYEVLYPNPDFFRQMVNIWSKKHYRTFEKWVAALSMKYNPLENYDRQEDWNDITDGEKSTFGRKDSGNTRTLDHQDKRTLDTEDKRTLDTQDLRTLDTQDLRTLDTEDKRTLDTEDLETRDIEDKTTFDKTTTTDHEVSAYDASTYQPSSKDTQDEDGTVTVNGTGTDTFNHTGTDTLESSGTDTMDHTGTDTLDHTGTDTMDHTGTDTVDYSGTIKDEYGEGFSSTDTDDTTITHSGRIHGNIGVTTSQQMLQSELDIARFNIIEQITDLFMQEFLIMLYD